MQHRDGEGRDVLSAASAWLSEKAENAEAFQVHRFILSLTLNVCIHVNYLHSEISPPTEIHFCDPERTQGFQNGLGGKGPKDRRAPTPCHGQRHLPLVLFFLCPLRSS